ncbi:MAG: molybdopterin-dependent oxidoreductase [Planctomycetaceae bacterium]
MNPLNRRQFVSSAFAGAAMASISWSVASRTVSAMMQEEPSIDPAKMDLIYRSKAPRNGEPKLEKLVENWITPTPQFYIRSHGANPAIVADEFKVSVEGMVENPLVFSIQELIEKFPKSSCTCTVSCAGIRRYEFNKVKEIKGVAWQEGPIGNAVWSGVRLLDVLKAAGIKTEAKHVWFEGADEIVDGKATFPFGGSVPLTKLLEEECPMPGVLLATHMNGEPLLPDHGFPIRTIVPGYIGARSVKWLRKIVVSDKPSPNHFIADVYKMVYSGTPVEIDETAPIYRYPVNAALCSAEKRKAEYVCRATHCQQVAKGAPSVVLKSQRTMEQRGQPPRWEEVGDFCWQLWSSTLTIANAETDICVRATDSLGNTMPRRCRGTRKVIFTMRGIECP